MGLLQPTSGTAAICGHDAQRDGLQVKRLAGYVPESGAVFDVLTGWEYLMMVGALHGLAEEEVRMVEQLMVLVRETVPTVRCLFAVLKS